MVVCILHLLTYRWLFGNVIVNFTIFLYETLSRTAALHFSVVDGCSAVIFSDDLPAQYRF